MEKNNNEEIKADEYQKDAPQKPKWISNGVAVWINQSKQLKNKTYLTIKLVGHNTIYANEQ